MNRFSQGHGRSLEVLVVENGEFNRRLIRHLLEGLGCRVDVAETGETGIEMAIAHRYDAIVLDLEIPDVDAREAMARIRDAQHIRDERRSPIVAISVDEPGSAAADFDAYLTKPVTPEDFRHALDAVTTVPVFKPGADEDDLDIANNFVEMARFDLSEMRCALERRDFAVLEREASRLKGLAQSFGYSALSSASGSIEGLARSHSRVEIDAWLSHLNTLLDRAA